MSDTATEFDDSGDVMLEKTLRVINALETEGIIGRYAIAGAVGFLFYTEPAVTYDLDIFCHLPQSGLLIDIGPLYEYLSKQGYEVKGDHVIIEGVPVQFLPPPTPLVEEALAKCVETSFNGIPTRVFQYEYLLAIKLETGRPKDKLRVASALESAEPDLAKLEDILGRYNLLDKWRAIVS